jgi:hypothetical protein
MVTTLLVVPIAIVLVLAGHTYYRWYQHRYGGKTSRIPVDVLRLMVLFTSGILVLLAVSLASSYFQLERAYIAVVVAVAVVLVAMRALPLLRRS